MAFDSTPKNRSHKSRSISVFVGFLIVVGISNLFQTFCMQLHPVHFASLIKYSMAATFRR